MSKAPAQLTQLIERIVIALGYELVGIEYFGQGRRYLLRIYIDSSNGIGLDDCVRVSNQLSNALAVEDPIPGPYTLEVSSPGLDRPLFELRDFQKFVGRKIQAKILKNFNQSDKLPSANSQNHETSIDGRRKILGLLKEVHSTHLIIEEQGHELIVPLARIDKANLVPEF